MLKPIGFIRLSRELQVLTKELKYLKLNIHVIESHILHIIHIIYVLLYKYAMHIFHNSIYCTYCLDTIYIM